MEINKKTLLIFFGELRTFEYVIPHLKKLDNVDVMLSTWVESKRYDDKFEIDENKIYEIYPNIKYCNIIDFKQIDDFESKNNSWKIQHHWKTSINSVKNYDEYDNVILHRCDLLSNWHSILDMDIKEDTLYLHYTDYPKFYFPDRPEIFWVNDYYFFGKPNIVKKFINLIKNEINMSPHYDMWEAITKNNINIEKYILRASLVRDNNIEMSQKESINVSELGFLVGPDHVF
jgi:hypothetical protein